MSKQTAVEWYAQKDNEIMINFLEGKINKTQLAIEKVRLFDRAIAMEQEQILNAWMDGEGNGDVNSYIDANLYYQEIYGGGEK